MGNVFFEISKHPKSELHVAAKEFDHVDSGRTTEDDILLDMSKYEKLFQGVRGLSGCTVHGRLPTEPWAPENLTNELERTPEDVTLISKLACTLMCNILNRIEMGTMQWPRPVLTARAAFMATDPTKLEDPLTSRILTVLPVVYR